MTLELSAIDYMTTYLFATIRIACIRRSEDISSGTPINPWGPLTGSWRTSGYRKGEFTSVKDQADRTVGRIEKADRIETGRLGSETIGAE